MFAYEKVKEEIKYRIDSGYYVLRKMPSFRKLANELGVSTFTVRRALDELNKEHADITDGSTAQISGDSETRTVRIGYLCPQWSAYPYRDFFIHQITQYDANIRVIPYYDWKDPLIVDTINAFDACFIIPCAQEMPERIAQLIRDSGKPIVILERDTSALGIPCIRMIRPVATSRLLDYLSEKGHKRIECLNSQPHDEIILERLEMYRLWMLAHQQNPNITDVDPENYSVPQGVAYHLVQQKIKEAEWNPTAIMATTLPGAIGAIRALREAGIKPGTDIAVCAVDDESLAAYVQPPITTADAAAPEKPEAFLHICMQWILSGKPWEGSLLLQPADTVVNARASTESYSPK